MDLLRGSRRVQIALAVVLVVALVAIGALLLRPSGADDPSGAAFDRVAEEDGSVDPEALLEREWGDGRFVLVGYGDEERTLGLAFAIDRGRGWRVAGWTSEVAQTTDVKVASLLVASSSGGDGQPAWSAAYGELGDERITSIEVEWSEGEPTRVDVDGRAYFVIRADVAEPTFVRYLDDEGEEIAKVPAQPA